MTRHPLFERAAAGGYFTTAETARLIRERLARAYPGVTFYVRSSVYAGGSSVHIAYDGIRGYRCLNGHACESSYDCPGCGLRGSNAITTLYAPGAPTVEQVNAITAPYASRDFDGSIDLAYVIHSWMTPDGNAFFGRSDGTQGSMGSDTAYSNARPVPGAVMVTFGASYVFVEPRLPYDVTHKAEEAARKARARERKAAAIAGGWRSERRIP